MEFTTYDNLINKKIIYSDTVMPLKGKLKNLKATSVCNVYGCSLDKCLKIILESNSNVMFYTILYSPKMKRVVFYTNSEISLKEYEDTKVFEYKNIKSNKEMLEEIKNVLLLDKNTDSNNISLYDLLNFYKDKNLKYDRVKKNYASRLNYCFNNGSVSSSFIVYGYDYDKKELSIGFKYFNDYKKMVFIKRNGDLFIKYSEFSRGKDIFYTLCNELYMLYDEYEYYREFKEQYNFGVKTVNSNFKVDISSNQINVYLNRNLNYLNNILCLEAYCYDKADNSKYNYENIFYDALILMKGHEDEVLKKLYVRISDCPKWSRGFLYEIRKKQLIKEQDDFVLEIKRQKKLELIRKILPFIKK